MATNDHKLDKLQSANHATQANQATHTVGTKKIIKCQRSGVPLVEITSLCSNGWALLSQPVMTTFIHPTYGLPLGKLIRKLELQLIDADQAEWEVPQPAITDISLAISAVMYAIEAMWVPNEDAIITGRNIEASLPDTKTTVGCASRILELASWYNAEASKKILFPLWKPSKNAGNLNWHGFSAWIDACLDIRDDYSQAKRRSENKLLARSTEDVLKLVSQAQVYKRIDTKKVWNWIELQASEHSDKYSVGRRETLKSLFMNGESEPEIWTPDDCDDLIEMMLDTCDIGNDITSYIRNRVSNIRAAIQDFYSDFTLIGSSSTNRFGESSGNGLELTASERSAEDKLFGEYEVKLFGMIEAPVKPDPAKYSNRVAALKAAAEWNILSKLWAARNKAATTALAPPASTDATVSTAI